MKGDPDQFVADVAQWVEKARGNVLGAFQGTTELALGRVRALTPVVTGFLRASWTAVPGTDAQPTEGGDAGAQAAILSLQLGDTIVITNPAPYAMRVNFGFVGVDSLGRHYDQKGRHMVEQTIAELPQLAETATRWVAGGGSPVTLMENA